MTRPEPEAAALRNVLRRVRVLLEKMTPHATAREHCDLLEEARGAVQAALDRPATNGEVIDALQKEVRDLRAVTIDMDAMRIDFSRAEAERDALLKERGTFGGAEEQRILNRLLEYACVKAWGEKLDDRLKEFVHWGIYDAATSYAKMRVDEREGTEIAANKLNEVGAALAHARAFESALEGKNDGKN